MITFDLEGDAYRIVRNEATSISEEAKQAIRSAKSIPRKTSRRVSCSRAIAKELRDWFRDHERGYLSVEDHAWKTPVCRRAAEAIEAAATNESIR